MTKEKLIIKNCHIEQPCQEEWDKLERIKYRKDIRRCSECNKQVQLVESDSDLTFAVHFNYCIAIPLSLIEQSTDIDADIKNYNDKSKWTTTHLLGAVPPATAWIK